MAVTEDRTIRLDREALAAALTAGGFVRPEALVLDVGRGALRAPGRDGTVREFAGAALAVLLLRYLGRVRVPVPRDATKRVVVGEEDVALVLHRTHRVEAALSG